MSNKKKKTSSEKHLVYYCKSLTTQRCNLICALRVFFINASQHMVTFLAFLYSTWIILCCELLNCSNCLKYLMFQVVIMTHFFHIFHVQPF